MTTGRAIHEQRFSGKNAGELKPPGRAGGVYPGHDAPIWVLDHGKIVEDGTYEELMEKKGFFAELVARQ